MELIKIDSPTQEDIEPIQKGIEEYGFREVNGIKPEPLAVLLKERGETIGGANGSSHFNVVFLSNLWVIEGRRDGGLGTKIHDEVVAFSRQRGCHSIRLQTLNEKALRFYQRNDYLIESSIDNYVKDFTLYHLVKRI